MTTDKQELIKQLEHANELIYDTIHKIVKIQDMELFNHVTSPALKRISESLKFNLGCVYDLVNGKEL